MIAAARAIYFTALGLWVGGLATLGAVVAPAVFRAAPSRKDAGRIFGSVLRTFGVVELVLAGLVLVTAWLLRKAPDLRWGGVRLLLVVLMAALVAVSVFGINPAVESASGKFGESTPEDDSGKAHFRALHRWSERLAGATLIAGLVLLLLSGAAVKAPPHGP